MNETQTIERSALHAIQVATCALDQIEDDRGLFTHSHGLSEMAARMADACRMARPAMTWIRGHAPSSTLTVDADMDTPAGLRAALEVLIEAALQVGDELALNAERSDKTDFYRAVVVYQNHAIHASSLLANRARQARHIPARTHDLGSRGPIRTGRE